METLVCINITQRLHCLSAAVLCLRRDLIGELQELKGGLVQVRDRLALAESTTDCAVVTFREIRSSIAEKFEFTSSVLLSDKQFAALRGIRSAPSPTLPSLPPSMPLTMPDHITGTLHSVQRLQRWSTPSSRSLHGTSTASRRIGEVMTASQHRRRWRRLRFVNSFTTICTICGAV